MKTRTQTIIIVLLMGEALHGYSQKVIAEFKFEKTQVDKLSGMAFNDTMKDNAPFNIMLADDDTDDCHLFQKALKKIPIATRLRTFSDGEKLMDYLFKNPKDLPDVIFLDLSMPRKTGYECLIEIKENKKMGAIPILVFTTSIPSNIEAELKLSNTLIKFGALDYIRKPADFGQFTHVIHQALIRVIEKAS